MIIVATSPGRMVVTANVITEMRNSVSAIESSRLRMYVMQLFGLTLSRAAGARFAPAAGASSRAQPHFVEPQVAAVRVNDRVEPTDRGLGADRTVAEPEDHVVILVVDSLLHLLVDVGTGRWVDRDARLLQEIVKVRIPDMAIVERAGRMPEAVIEEIRLPEGEEVHHRDLKILVNPDLAQPVGPGQLLDLHVDAGFLEPLEHDLRRLDVIRIVRGRLEDEVELAG